MSTTDQLNALSGHHSPDVSTGGRPTRIWAADVVTVNPDGSVDCQPVSSRATKVGVLVPGGYTPTVGDRVLVTDLNGDPRTPIVLVAISATAASSVTSFDGRKGPVTLTKGDVTGTGLAAADVGALAEAGNLSDLASIATALQNLGLPDATGKAPFLQLLSSLKLRMDSGSVTVTWAGVNKFSNFPTVTHGLGVVPAQVIVSADWTAINAASGSFNRTTTTFHVMAQTTDGSIPANGSTATLSWIAIG